MTFARLEALIEGLKSFPIYEAAQLKYLRFFIFYLVRLCNEECSHLQVLCTGYRPVRGRLMSGKSFCDVASVSCVFHVHLALSVSLSEA